MSLLRVFQFVTTLATVTVQLPRLAAAEPQSVKPNGSWCWFQGERAVVVENQIVFTTIAGDTYDEWQAGDLVATSFNPRTGAISHVELHDRFQSDDHDVAGLCVLPDQRILAVYSRHGNDPFQRSRITLRPGDISEWTPEATFDVGANTTYANVYRLPSENQRIYNFHRGRGYNPNCTISDDYGKTWRYGWRLLEWNREDLKNDPRYTGLDGSRPYLRYASNGQDTIHFLLTDDHPRAYDNSIYHGSYRNGQLFTSDGSPLARVSGDDHSPLKPSSFTEVFAGEADRVAWTSDMQIDQQGHPYIAFSVQVDGAATRQQRAGGGGLDHRYYYGRWDGKSWHVHPLAYAGTKLYAGEDDYTGLVALDPQDPSTVVISTNVDPVSGRPLISSSDGQRHWEIYQGVTLDSGRSWSWTALTANSNQDQLRPLIPAWSSGPRVILWARGKLNTYTDFHLDIMALTQER